MDGLYYIPVGRGYKEVSFDEYIAISALTKEQDNRRVAFDSFQEFEVSTVFLSINHGFIPKGPGNNLPILYETIIIENGEYGDMERYPTWDEAYFGHITTVERILCKKINENMLFEPITNLESIITEVKEPHYYKNGRLFLDDGVNPPRATFGLLNNIFYWRKFVEGPMKINYTVGWIDINNPKCDIMKIIAS